MIHNSRVLLIRLSLFIFVAFCFTRRDVVQHFVTRGLPPSSADRFSDLELSASTDPRPSRYRSQNERTKLKTNIALSIRSWSTKQPAIPRESRNNSSFARRPRTRVPNVTETFHDVNLDFRSCSRGGIHRTCKTGQCVETRITVPPNTDTRV